MPSVIKALDQWFAYFSTNQQKCHALLCLPN